MSVISSDIALAFYCARSAAGMVRMLTDRKRRRPYGAWLLALAAAAGTAQAIVAFLTSEGVNHTQGPAALIGSNAVMVIAALLIAGVADIPRYLRAIILVLLLFDIVATGIAAWFLELWVLVAFMAIALLGWLAHVAAGPGRRASVSTPRAGAVT